MEGQHDNLYLAFGGLSGANEGPKTRVEQAKAVGSAVYTGLKGAVYTLNKLSDVFPPLKTATEIFLTVSEFIEVCLSIHHLDLSFVNGFFWIIRLCCKTEKSLKTSKPSCKLFS